MEQYRCSGSATEDGALSLSLDDRQAGGGSSKISTDAKCLDGRKCSGFGRCSPANLDEKREGHFSLTFLPITANALFVIMISTARMVRDGEY